MKTTDKSILTVLADMLGLDPKSKDINTKILTRLKSDKTIPKELKQSAMSVIIPTPSEGTNMNLTFKEFRQQLKESSSHSSAASMASTDTIQHGYGYSKHDPSVHFDNDGFEIDDQTWEELDDDLEDIEFDEMVELGIYDPEELAVTDDEFNHIEDFDGVDPTEFDETNATHEMQAMNAELYSANESIQYTLNEALSLRGRMRLGQAMRRRASQLGKKRQIALKRTSSPEKLMHRAHNLVNANFYNKMLRGRDIHTLTPSEKNRLEVLRAKNASKLARQIPKAFNIVKQKEQQRLRR